ncbi:MAG: MoaD/ThiS family protein [Holophagaceae bacterium]|nr:MoaD/ThiS family protein [Holophagaceae bacterium]
MSITVELTYDLAKALGIRRLELEGTPTLRQVLALTRDRFGAEGATFDKLTRVTALVVNGVIASRSLGLDTPLHDGDRVSFLKAAAGG